MSYQVIARKYRPQRFADVVGQDHVTQTLANAIRQNRIAHAYLFVGPRGTGKTTIARIFAKCLNCTHGPKVDFAEDDPRCLEISEGRSLDVLEIDGASNRGIEEIRELRETVKYAPATSRFKIYIIDEVHMLTKEAFNALLKTLEEPPAHVKFMFATTEPEKVLPTILSRCQRFDLRRIPAQLIVAHLAFIARQEQVDIDPAALAAIARGAEGCMRDAESTLDQLISFCGLSIVETEVLSMFGLASRSQILELAEAVMSGDAEAALRRLDDLARNGKDLGRLVSDLLGHFRNVLLFQVSRGDQRLLEVTEADLASLKKHASLLPLECLGRILEILAECEGRLREAASKRTLLEITLIKAIQARQAVSIDALLQRLAQWRATGAATPLPTADLPEIPEVGPRIALSVDAPVSPTIPAPDRSEPPVDRPAVAMPLAPPVASVEAVKPAESAQPLELLWGQLVETIGKVSPFTRSYLLLAHPISWENQVLTIGFPPENADSIELVNNPKNRTLIQSKIEELGWGSAQIKLIKSEAGSPTRDPVPVEAAKPPPAPKSAEAPAPKPAIAKTESKPVRPAPSALTKDELKNDPLIKQALEIFRGQITEIHP